MRTRHALTVLVPAVLFVGACSSSSSPNAGDYVDSVDRICRNLQDDLDEIGAPSDFEGLSDSAFDAADAFGAAAADLRKLAEPKDTGLAGDVRDLADGFDDSANMLDDISNAAKDGDSAGVADAEANLDAVREKNAELADSIDARRCDLDLLFTSTEAPPETVAPTIPETVPDTTEPTSFGKEVFDLTDSLVSDSGYQFSNGSADVAQAYIDLLDSVPELAAATGGVTVVELLNAEGGVGARVFVFIADDPMSTDAVDALAPNAAEGAALNPDVIDTFSGYTFADSEGKTYFIGLDDGYSNLMMVLGVGVNRDEVDTAINAVFDSLAD